MLEQSHCTGQSPAVLSYCAVRVPELPWPKLATEGDLTEKKKGRQNSPQWLGEGLQTEANTGHESFERKGKVEIGNLG